MNERPITRVLAAVHSVTGREAKRNGAGYLALCPAHDDRNPSLSITEADDLRVLLCCHAGCSIKEICASFHIEARDLFVSGDNDSGGMTVGRKGDSDSRMHGTYATRDDAVAAAARSVGGTVVEDWPYHDEGGAEVLRVVRFSTPDGKQYRPIHKAGDGWEIGAPPGLLPLYNLPALAGAGDVFVVEGEKCAEVAKGIGLVTTTSAHGSNAAHRTDWSHLAGKRVVILPDLDDAGSAYAETVASILSKLNPPASIKIVRIPVSPRGRTWRTTLSSGIRRTATTWGTTLRAWLMRPNPGSRLRIRFAHL